MTRAAPAQFNHHDADLAFAMHSRDLSLGDLIEGIVLHAFENKAPFSPATVKKIAQLKAVYGLDLSAADSHQLRENSSPRSGR